MDSERRCHALAPSLSRPSSRKRVYARATTLTTLEHARRYFEQHRKNSHTVVTSTDQVQTEWSHAKEVQVTSNRRLMELAGRQGFEPR
jgi:hypothetical protein